MDKMKQSAILNVYDHNELIADFMELEQISADIRLWIAQPIKEPGTAYPVNLLEYHSSWDWLMPVVEKIESTGLNVRIDINSCAIIQIGDSKKKQYFNMGHLIDSKINMIYKAVVEFIKWYNKQAK